MSDFLYKNPLTPEQLNGAQSVTRTETFGTNFSVLGIGGFMEIYNITDLYFIIPPATTGPIELSGNTLPISFFKGDGSVFSFDTLTLNSDNISSGRRRLGMLVYVYETDQVYQYQIDNFLSLWSAATGSTGIGGDTVVFSDFGTTVKNNSVAGQSFIDAWTANTIDGVSGNVRSNSVWKKYHGTNLAVTGGTFDSFTGTLNLVNITGGTVPITGISGGGGGGSITGGTFNLSNGNLTLSSSAGTITIPGFLYGTGTTNTIPKYVTSSGFTNSQITDDGINVTIGGNLTTISADLLVNQGITATTISATTYYNLPIDPDSYVTGFTSNGNQLTIGQNRNDSFSSLTLTLTGITATTSVIQGITGITGTSGVSASTNDYGTTIINTAPDQTVKISGGTGITTGGTYPNFTLVNSAPDQTVTITGGTNIQVVGTYPNFGINFTGTTSGEYLPLSGGTVSGGTIFTNGLTANTVSATTYYNLPVSGLTEGGDISITDNNGNFTISFTGTTGSNFTGGTVTGATIFTNGLTANTISATTYQNLPVSAVTNGDGISVSGPTNGVVTITNTGVTSVTATSGLSGSSTTGNITLINTQVQGVTGITATDGLSGDTTNFATIIINTDKGSSQNIFKNIQIGGITQFGANSNNSDLNFSGIGITITSASTNTLVFTNQIVQGITGITGGDGITATTSDNVTTITNLGVTGITAGYGLSGNSSTGNVTLIQVFDYGKAYTTGNNLNYI